jgi:hypothetical protein
MQKPLTRAQVRELFWETHPELEARAREARRISKPQNDQDTDTRCAFVDFIDALHRAGQISDRAADQITL